MVLISDKIILVQQDDLNQKSAKLGHISRKEALTSESSNLTTLKQLFQTLSTMHSRCVSNTLIALLVEMEE